MFFLRHSGKAKICCTQTVEIITRCLSRKRSSSEVELFYFIFRYSQFSMCSFFAEDQGSMLPYGVKLFVQGNHVCLFLNQSLHMMRFYWKKYAHIYNVTSVNMIFSHQLLILDIDVTAFLFFLQNFSLIFLIFFFLIMNLFLINFVYCNYLYK